MPEDRSGVRVLSILDEETVPVVGGSLEWVPVRRRLGIRAFGMNAYRAAKAGDCVIEEHEETPGQEELYLVVAGKARITAGDEVFDCLPGTAVFVRQADLTRSGTALEDGTVVVAVGGWPDRPYHPLPWEPIFLAHDAMRRGKWAEAAGILEREAGEHRESPFVRYRLAACYAGAGETARALDELGAAIAAKPGLRERAAADEDFGPLRELDGWHELVGGSSPA